MKQGVWGMWMRISSLGWAAKPTRSAEDGKMLRLQGANDGSVRTMCFEVDNLRMNKLAQSERNFCAGAQRNASKEVRGPDTERSPRAPRPRADSCGSVCRSESKSTTHRLAPLSSMRRLHLQLCPRVLLRALGQPSARQAVSSHPFSRSFSDGPSASTSPSAPPAPATKSKPRRVILCAAGGPDMVEEMHRAAAATDSASGAGASGAAKADADSHGARATDAKREGKEGKEVEDRKAEAVKGAPSPKPLPPWLS
jgi:hypothetical protein